MTKRRIIEDPKNENRKTAMIYLITAAGLIDSHIAPKLLARGERALALDNFNDDCQSFDTRQ